MEDTRQTDKSSDNDILRNSAFALGHILTEHRAHDVVALDLRDLSLWADFFIIATTTSTTHQAALACSVKEGAESLGLEFIPHRGATRIRPDRDTGPDEWRLIDLGSIVVHLMSEKTRAFYDLERLWSAAQRTVLNENDAAS
jgi:ribosome-associated protein